MQIAIDNDLLNAKDGGNLAKTSKLNLESCTGNKCVLFPNCIKFINVLISMTTEEEGNLFHHISLDADKPS